MPIYEYRCLECQKDYEEIVSLGVQIAPPCPFCKSEKVEKKMSTFGSAGPKGASCGKSGFS
jgi:putative FmdB family regulatory protein